MKRINVTQMELELKVITSKEVDGVEMGVLSNGTPFLTGRGLSKVCGISNSTLVEWGEFTPEIGARFRAGKMAELLAANGFDRARFFEKISLGGLAFGGAGEISVYTDPVCMAFLEYYAFEAGKWCSEEAKNNYRVLARKSLRDYIYKMTGYDPMKQIQRSWQHFHDRLLLNPIPVGYFSVFRETADMVLESIRNGLEVDSHTVPDISVGKSWSEVWTFKNLNQEHGDRVKYPHFYPDYFPQSLANGSINPYIYPVGSLGVFKQWIQNEYLPFRYPTYLNRKAKQGAISPSEVPKILKALAPIQLKKAS
jgi:hypothetical protein